MRTQLSLFCLLLLLPHLKKVWISDLGSRREKQSSGVQGGRHQLKYLEIQAVRWARWECRDLVAAIPPQSGHHSALVTCLRGGIWTQVPHLWIFQKKLEIWIFRGI